MSREYNFYEKIRNIRLLLVEVNYLSDDTSRYSLLYSYTNDSFIKTEFCVK